MTEKKYTPMMKQYLETKSKLLDCIVFYRLGDFYEMFFDDAKIASNELDLVLTGRNAGVEEKVPMCGIPYHAASGYITRLTQKGYKVAIVEQMTDPEAGKIVEREVIKIVTPGTIMEDTLDEKSTNYIASISDFKYGFALVYCELNCGELRAKTIERTSVALQKALLSMNVREVVVANDFEEKFKKIINNLQTITISYEDNTQLDHRYHEMIKNIDDQKIIDSFALLSNYLTYTQKRVMEHLGRLEMIQEDEYLQMDYSTRQNLELITPVRTNSKSLTLWSFLDHCETAMGSRMLKRFIEYPLIDMKSINERLDAIEYINFNFIKKDELKEYLKHIYDLERLCTKVAYGTANPRDLLRLISSLQYAPMILDTFKDCTALKEKLKVSVCNSLYEKLNDNIVEDPPVTLKDGGVFKKGYNKELDECRTLKNHGRQFILDIETKEKERTGVSKLKIGYNRIFGYYIEISRVNLDKIKPEFGYVRKQTLVNAERFVTAELKEKEDAILHAEEKAIRLERELYRDLLDEIKVYLSKLHELADALALIDVIYALSNVSSTNGYVRPVFHEKNYIELLDSRHPILDKLQKDQRYIANSLEMEENDQVLIITGPNMGGKSTYMRQVALSVILAQIGCFVPAKKYDAPIFKKIFTRIGASDDIMSGQSTFMVEMIEANYALKNADDHSLIIFDEIGRGTSTYDGMSLAQAMIEYLLKTTKAKVLFSTHYHELTAMGEQYESISNVHVDVKEENGDITFLYKVVPGPANKSYGINVARLANLPEAIIERSSHLLAELKTNGAVASFDDDPVMIAEDNKSKEVAELIEQVNADELKPLEALELIYELKKRLKND